MFESEIRVPVHDTIQTIHWLYMGEKLGVSVMGLGNCVLVTIYAVYRVVIIAHCTGTDTGTAGRF